jgi:replication-associated recombination protein RarA
MEVIIQPSKEAAAALVARIIAHDLRANPHLVLGLATGATMERVYRRLVSMHNEEHLDFSLCSTFNLDEYVGQEHLLAVSSPLRRLVEGDDRAVSLILYGPPGTGKTTLAHLVSNATGRRYVELSAVTAGVKEVRAVIDMARRELGMGGPETVLFVDEVHRFSKTQQDALLPAVENGWVVLIAATTENPHFALISPLLSRSLLVTLHPLEAPADSRV